MINFKDSSPLKLPGSLTINGLYREFRTVRPHASNHKKRMNKLIQHISEVVLLDENTKWLIYDKFKLVNIKKGDILLEENNICNKLWYIEKGIIRQYIILNGEESNKWFYTDNQWATSHYSYFEQKPAFDYLQAYEDTTAFSITFSEEKELLDNLQYLKFHVLLLRNYLSILNFFMRDYKHMTADEKYKFCIDNHPQFIQRIKLKELASLIGISQETLSRIRARL